jgi:hypothetical protein
MLEFWVSGLEVVEHTVCSCKREEKNVRIKLNFILTFLKTSGTWVGGVRRVLKSVENKARKKL